MKFQNNILQYVQLAAISVVAISCYQVVSLFVPAILFAIVVCISTWPLYLHLRTKLNGKSTLAALLMVFLLLVLVIAPTVLLAFSLLDSLSNISDVIKLYLSHGPIKTPTWMKDIPIFGERINQYLQSFTSVEKESMALLDDMFEPIKSFTLSTTKIIAKSFMQMLFAVFIGFFLYRDGEKLILQLHNLLIKIAGNNAEEILKTVQHTVASVVHGIFGAAIAQALLATVGFLIANVPGAFLLGTATFFLSLFPVGPPLIWGSATIWLIYQGDYGWAVFMGLWGLIMISSIDNFLKPYLISRQSDLSILLATLGVFGGIAAFDFIGIFIGPPILAVGLMLVRLWTSQKQLNQQGEQYAK